jgi:hypothetical protein
MKKGVLVLAVWLVSTSGCGGHDKPPPPPPAPENLKLDPAGPHQVELSWTTAPSEGRTFIIERSENDTAYAPIGESSLPSFVDTGVSPEASYVYEVYAQNRSGKSAPVFSGEYRHPYLDACTAQPPAQDEPTVRFYDIQVGGLNYLQAQQFRVTDSGGSFQWDRYGDIPFSIGYIDIGTLKAGDKVGLRPLIRNQGGDIKPALTNLLRLLIALDEDAQPSNGIQLPCELSLAYGEIDPTSDFAEFARQETVARLTGGTPLPSAQEAKTIYQQSLFRDYVGHYALTWRILIDGILPIEATIPFDINEQGEIVNTGESIVDATVDPHSDYRLKIVDMAALALSSLGYYKLEIHANIRPDQTIDGEVVIKGLMGDAEGTVSGGRE